ncbi:endonuclease domain-containing protein [Sphingomonas sp. SAFR-052]|uniref:endonuclease domain-containing protein n=1 Tax=Sphingomonas sp. SAFR-052 TaxID=3436867 RepID=UPI003F7F5EDC
MRRRPTDAERALWRMLRDRRMAAFKFWRQQPIGRYIVDFVCFEQRLVVEADGSQHVDCGYDRDHDHWLAGQGSRVLRFFNSDILDNPEGVCTAIRVALYGIGNGIEPSPMPPLSPTLPHKGGGSPRSI